MTSWKCYAAALALAAAASVGLAGCTAQPAATGPDTEDSGSAASAFASATRPAKPAVEHMPDGKVLTAYLIGREPTTAPDYKNVITDPATIAEIAADINALPTMPHVVGYCPEIPEPMTPELTLEFRDSVTGPWLAQVQLTATPTGPCGGGLQVRVRGVNEPPLDDSKDPTLFAQLLRLTGLTQAGLTAAPSASSKGGTASAATTG